MDGRLIYPMVPYDLDRNLGAAYNRHMDLLPPDAWAIFMDHDAMPTTPKWFPQFAECIAFAPDAGAFAVTTNRIASMWQRAAGAPENDDVAAHRRFGHSVMARRTLLDISQTKGFGGVAFAVSKSAWEAAGGFAHGLGCVDHSLFFGLQRAGLRVWLVEGIYFYHWRHRDEPDPTQSAPKAPNCPCRGAETQPTFRVRLP